MTLTTMITNPVPTDRRYTDVHSWLALASDERLGDHPLRVGVTETAIEGARVIAVELPPVGTAVDAGEPCALIWTDPLSAMPVYAPITGLVTTVNTPVRDDPRIVARDPFHTGWLFTVLPAAGTSADDLLTAANYANLFGLAVDTRSSWPHRV
jgi:glycine cleavage system H protein